VVREDVSLAELARVEARREWFPSLEVEQAALRDYPDGAAVAHAVGYVGEVSEAVLSGQSEVGTIEQGDVVGKSGVENRYDDILRGRRGWRLVTVNSIGRMFGDAQPGKVPEDGREIRLTIDIRLQRELAEALGEEVGAGVFLDPRTGEVLALASTPAYDPNVFAGRVRRAVWQGLIKDPKRPLNDRAIASFYAPGSTFKILMSLAGLETGTITPSSLTHCSGSATIYGTERLCWKKGGHGSVAVHQALVHSCNVFYYRLGQQLGIDAITKYGGMFHLGGLTGIDLPGERRGILPSSAWKKAARNEVWYAGDTISAAIGQGLLAVTPVQMATLVSGIATGSVPRPHLRRDGDYPPEPLPVRAENLAVIRAALADVVEEGTGRRASLGSIRVAGKTGTAQVFKKSRGVDADKLPKDERDHAWFVGYAPAENPEIAFAVVVEHGGHGGTTAAPVVRRVLEVFFQDRLPKKRPIATDPALRAAAVTAREGAVAAAAATQ
jgi:penicillin-binding protein 2